MPAWGAYIIIWGWFLAICAITHYLSDRPTKIYKPYVDKNYITEVETW